MVLKLIVEYELNESDFKDVMEDGLSLEEAINQTLDDGDLELNETPIISTSMVTEDQVMLILKKEELKEITDALTFAYNNGNTPEEFGCLSLLGKLKELQK